MPRFRAKLRTQQRARKRAKGESASKKDVGIRFVASCEKLDSGFEVMGSVNVTEVICHFIPARNSPVRQKDVAIEKSKSIDVELRTDWIIGQHEKISIVPLHACLVNEIRREHRSYRYHRVLTPSLHRIAKTRHQRQRRSRERFKKIAVAKTVSERQVCLVSQTVIDTRVEAVVIIALRRRRDEVLKRHVAVWQWI